MPIKKQSPIQAILPNLLSIEDIISDVMNKNPMHFVENIRMVKGDDFKIVNTGRDYLIEVFNYICFQALKPEGKPVVVVKGRQVEFTETMLNICLYYLYHMRNITILYAFPTADQVRRFSNDRFEGAIRESKGSFLKELMFPGGKQNVHHKQFKGNNQIFLYSAWRQADTLRGITCDVMVKDEVQDWTKAAIQNTQEAMSQSKYKVNLSIGTPKGEGTHYHEIWEKSDKRYFHAKCTNCPDYFKITLQVCKKGIIVECPSCKHWQDKRDAIREGKWIATVKDSDKVLYTGFHLSQLLHPNITIEDVERKRKEYGERRFKNEVLGEFSGGLDNPLTPPMVIDIINDEKWNTPEWAYPITVSPPDQTVMGIDWGAHSEEKQKGSYTALVIAKPYSQGKYQIVFSHKFNHNNYKSQVEEIEELIYRYNCQQIVADQGFGHVQIQMLQEEFQGRVVACTYQSNMKNAYKYDPETWTVSVDKDSALEELYDEIKRHQWIIPLISTDVDAFDSTPVSTASDPVDAEVDKYEWLIHHWCNVEIVNVLRNGNTRKSFQKINRPCDGLHATNYCRIAMIIKGHIQKNSVISSQGNVGNYAPPPVLARFGGRFNRRPY